MLHCVHDHPQEVAQFVASRIPYCHRGFGRCHAMGVIDDDGRLVGGVVYHNHDPEAGLMEMSGAALSSRWLTRDVLFQMYWYPYLHCGCQMTVMRVPADNERLLILLARFGYLFVKQRRLFGRDRDGVIASLTAEDWAKNKFNQPRAEAPMQEAA